LFKYIDHLQGFFLGEAFSFVLFSAVFAKILQKLVDPHYSCFAFLKKTGEMQ